MTDEQKAAVEGAVSANSFGMQCILTAAMQHVIENPSNFGLVEKRLVDAGIQLRIKTIKTCEETHLQNEKYREALESILIELDDMAFLTASDKVNYDRAVKIAKEALKQGEK